MLFYLYTADYPLCGDPGPAEEISGHHISGALHHSTDSLYHAMEYTVQGQWEQAASTGKSTLLLAAGIALGMMVGTFIMRSCLVAAKK